MCYPRFRRNVHGGPNLVHLDAEVFGKKRLCQLCGKFGANLASQSYGKRNRIVLLQGRTSLKKDPFTLNMEALRLFEIYYNTSADPKEHQLINNRSGDLKAYSFALIVKVYIPALELLVLRNKQRMAQEGREHEAV